VQRVSRARALRGEPGRGLRALGRVALPVLQDTLERSLALASAMDSRGYGRVVDQSPLARTTTGLLTLGGLVGAAIGSYAVLDPELPRSLGPVMLVAGVVLVVVGLAVGGRAVRRTTYRPDPWGAPEWVTALSGIAAAVTLLVTARSTPAAVVQPLQPLAAPGLPLLAVAGLLLAALPAAAAPAPPAPRRRGGREAVAR
jgi:energy-coupling factor transport system permease protein